ncbi:MAG: prenyltransferase [Syntrophaceae bacterium]|nr:prenyltransferase [Syntrophaceae bacterium]
MKKLGTYLAAWWRLSRVPFLSVGILPLILGFVLAWRWGYKGPFGLYLLSSMSVILIMWMTYYLGERNDLEGDRINQDFNRFSGGSRVLVKGFVPPWFSSLLGYASMVGAVLTGFYIYWRYQTGFWTLLLGGIGISSGFFYSNKPFRWSYRGVGEMLIGFCYGWLPIATGFYLFTGFFSHQILLLSIPVGLSIFNVILINEFPDEEADRAIGKRNLVVRFGKERMGDLYMGLSILVALSFVKVLGIFGQTPAWPILLSAFPLALILSSLIRVWREDFRDPKRLEGLCRNTLLINLSITMILTVQQTLISSIARRP